MIAAPIDGLTVEKLKETWKREIQQKIKQTIPTGHDARVKVHSKANRIIRNLGQCTNYLKTQISDITKKQVRIIKKTFIYAIHCVVRYTWIRKSFSRNTL
jgi:hypothetical protein